MLVVVGVGVIEGVVIVVVVVVVVVAVIVVVVVVVVVVNNVRPRHLTFSCVFLWVRRGLGGGGLGGLVTSGSPPPYVRGVRSLFMFFSGCLMYWCSFQGWGLGGGGGLGGL